MKNILITLLLALTSTSTLAKSPLIIYGEDNRQDISQVYDWKAKLLAKSVASRIYKKAYLESSGKIYFGDPKRIPLLSTAYQLGGAQVCKDEKFAYQPTLADCTGFLVGEDLLLTAGHCMIESMGEVVQDKSTPACEENSWMFDYASEKGSIQINGIDKSKMYNCSKVVFGRLDQKGDFALVKLDRKVTGRHPLKFRKSGSVQRGQSLFVIGNPSGLPLKYASGAKVVDNQYSQFFSANLDTFGGNSGSPVFNAETYEVEGILVRGRDDYYIDEANNCRRPNTCDQNGFGCNVEDESGLGAEHVNRLEQVIKYIK